MDEHKSEAVSEQTPKANRKSVLKNWLGLIAGTLILIGCALLAAKAIEKAMVTEVVYDEVITMDINDLYGGWKCAELVHQSAAISSSLELRAPQFENVLVDITEQHFYVSELEWRVERPSYILHTLEEPTGSFDDVRAILGEDVLGYYSILSEGGTVKPYRIYFSKTDYWVAEFSDQNDAGIVVLSDIFRIERVN